MMQSNWYHTARSEACPITVFTALSLVLHEPGQVIQVDEKLHPPITQELGVIAASAHKADARRFADFVLGGKGREILIGFGYR